MGKPATVASSALIMMGGVETADAQYWRGHGWSYHGGYYRHGGWRGPRRSVRVLSPELYPGLCPTDYT